MNQLENIIRFYRDCYQQDLKGIRVSNFVSKTSNKRLTPTNNEFFHSTIDKIHVESEWAAEVEKILLLNHKEKALYAGSYFIKGNRSMLGETSTNYIPLYIHELDLVKIEKVYFIEVSDTYLNPDFIEMMNSMDQELSFKSDIFEQKLPGNPFEFEYLLEIENFFKEYCPSWNIDELSNYHDPQFDFSKQFASLKRLKTGTKRISSSLIIGVFNKPQGSLGVINELTSLADNLTDSPLLNQFFRLEQIPISELEERKVFVPASLSDVQYDSILKAGASPVSMILGPPGTGKSFTISCLALDAICHDKSVLVISKNSQATRVVSNIIEKKFGVKGKLVKADNQRYKRGLASRLSRMITWSKTSKASLSSTINSVIKRQSDIDRTLKKITESEQKEIEWGKFYHDNKKGFFSAFRDKWIQYQKSKTDLVWKLNSSLTAKNRLKNKTVKSYVKETLEKKLQRSLKTNRANFTKLINALKENNYTKLDEQIHKIDFSLILNALPVWLTTTKQISKHLPLRKELFDLVIVDEASQCDIASLIPAIYRAKNLVVVGDPQQLNHISFLSDKKQEALRVKYNLDTNLPNYRKESAIDWTNDLLKSQNQVTFLNDHYRSKPAIIKFSNEEFYDEQLTILKSHPIQDIQESVIIRKTDGVRNKKGVNEIEAVSILNEIKLLIAEYENIDAKVAPTIGISSPISAQVSYLKSCINKELSSDVIRKHNILIGTPFHFQGEERDIMYISFTIDPETHFGTINYFNREDVFNVLITRARNKQYIFISTELNHLPASSLLRRYLEYDHEHQEVNLNEDSYDKFLLEVTEFLKNSGYHKIYNSITVSGVEVDLTIVNEQEYFCVDLIGYPGEFTPQFSSRNIEILNRMNVPVYFIPYSCWVLNIDQTKKDLLNFLGAQRN